MGLVCAQAIALPLTNGTKADSGEYMFNVRLLCFLMFLCPGSMFDGCC